MDFVPTPPRQLYSTETLLGGFNKEEPNSWTQTLDGRAYQAYVAAGERAPDADVARRQAEHDAAITTALAATLAGLKPVAIMGGHALSRDDLAYKSVARIARDLSKVGFTILSGGGPGAMEAAHLGARLSDTDDEEFEWRLAGIASGGTAKFPLGKDDHLTDSAGKFNPELVKKLHVWQIPAFEIADITADRASQSIGIPTWLYGHEPPTPLATHHAKYFANSIREDGLLAVAKYGVIYAPGSAGTLQEIYQDAAQNYYRSVDVFSPMVFLDTDQVWTAKYAVDTALKSLFLPQDYSSMVAFLDRPEDVVPAIVERSVIIDAPAP